MLSNYVRLYNTIKFLKPIQIKYRAYYFVRKKFRLTMGHKYTFLKKANVQTLNLQKSIHVTDCYLGTYHFKFLNLETKFKNNIDWNYDKYGKLWTYNLTYFDYLSQEKENDAMLLLIDSFIENLEHIEDGLEPFPISLRGMNWIKYFSFYKIKNKKINNSLYAQYYILLDNLEYHLLGNHLLENAFSLLFAAYYFKDEELYSKAKEILLTELKEQILEDGAHFELSPMYHQIMLFRILDCINLVDNNFWKEQELLKFLMKKAGVMLGWLENIVYKNGDIPLLNDSANNIAPTSEQLFEYANRLGVRIHKLDLSVSGYRKVVKEHYESVIDIGNIGAEYIPGHAHADTFNFELMLKGKPFIIDMGLSTYETNDRRKKERATSAHNTVEVGSKSQSEVWGGFRVGERAQIISLEEGDDFVKATHNGYKRDNVYHTREWRFKDNTIIIKDSLSQKCDAIARFHFHPSVKKDDFLKVFNFHNQNFKIKNYKYTPEFNKYYNAFVLEISFKKKLRVDIEL